MPYKYKGGDHIKRLIIICSFLGLLLGCSQNEVKPDNPVHTTLLMKTSIDRQNYTRFTQLFSEGRANSVPKSDFEGLKTITSTSTLFNNYELLTFDNGNMILVRLTPPNENGEVEIEDVKIVPEEMKSLFSDK